MKKFLLVLIIFIGFAKAYCQNQVHHSLSQKHVEVGSLVDKINSMNLKAARDFRLKFDTMYVLLQQDLSQEVLISTMIVEYDVAGRVALAKIISALNEDDYHYKYYYNGNQSRFYKMDYLLIENNTEVYKGFQTHFYNSKGLLVSSREFSETNESIYADSLDVTYDINNRIRSYSYLSYQEGAWLHLGGVSNIVYSGEKIITYEASESEVNQEGRDTLINYRYEDVEFHNDDASFLFREINEFFEVDSSGVDRFFLSREDAAFYFKNKPLQYVKYKIGSGGSQDLLVETSEFSSGPELETIVRNEFGAEKYRTYQAFDDENRLVLYYDLTGTDTLNKITAEYNEHGRISKIESRTANDHFIENDLYNLDSEGRLVEFRQEIFSFPDDQFATILKFGYQKTAKITTSVENKLYIYPNPASDLIYFNSETITEKGEVQIIDSNGKIRLIGLADREINVQHLTPGFYVIKLYDGKTIRVGNFIKL